MYLEYIFTCHIIVIITQLLYTTFIRTFHRTKFYKTSVYFECSRVTQFCIFVARHTTKFYNLVSNNVHVRFPLRNTCLSRDSRLHFASEVAFEDLQEDMTEEASFPQIAPVDRARSIGAGRRFIEIPSRIEQRRSPRLEFQFRTPTDDIVPFNDYEYA